MINHEQTRNKIIDITKLIEEQAKVAVNYKEKTVELMEDRQFGDDYKKDKLYELRKAYDNLYNAVKENISLKLEEILLLEEENEKVLDFDVPEYTNTLATIEALKEKLPFGTVEDIKLKFAGQHQILLVIEKLLEKYGIDLAAHNFEEYTRRAKLHIERLIDEARNIEYDEVSTIVSLKKLHNSVMRYAEVLGIEFSAEEKQLEISSEIMDKSIAKRVMGLE